MENSKSQFSISEMAFVLSKHKWNGLIVLLVGLMATLIWLFCVRDDLYSADAKVLVKIGTEQGLPATVVGGAPQVIGYRSQEVNSEVEILKNTALIAHLVDDLGLDKTPPEPPPPTGTVALMRYRVKHVIKGIRSWVDDTMVRLSLREKTPPRDQAINLIKGSLKVKAEKESNVFSAELDLPQKHAAAFALNRLLDLYLQLRPNLYETNGAAFFAEGVKRNRAELAKSEAEIHNFEAQGDISLLENQQSQLIRQIVESQAAEKEAELAVKDATFRVSQLDAELAKPDPNFGNLGDFERDSIPNAILRQISQLQQEREALRMTQLDSSDKIQNNRQQFKALVGILAANLRSTLAMKKTDLTSRQQALNALQAQLSTLHDKQEQWVAMHRDSGAQEQSLQFYQRKLEEITAADALQKQRVGNVVIIQRPVDVLQPVGLRKSLLFSIAALASLLAAIVWVCVLELFDDRIYILEQLESQVSAPVLAAIPSGHLPQLSPVAHSESHAATA